MLVQENFWQRRVLQPVKAQLTQGITPDQVALTVVVSGCLSIFPLFGLTTLLCFLAGTWLKLNQPLIQAINWLFLPIHVALLLPFYKSSELLGAPHIHLHLFMAAYHSGHYGELLQYWRNILGGIVVWAIVSPICAVPIYFVLRTACRMMTNKIHLPLLKPINKNSDGHL